MNAKILALFFAAALIVAAGSGFDREAEADPWWKDVAKEAKQAAKQAENAEGEDGAPEEVTLAIQGEPGTEFSGSCAVGGEKDELGGRVPQEISYRFAGDKLKCEIDQESAGALKVVMEAGDDRSVQRISSRDGKIKIAYSGDGFSSSTISTSGGTSSSSSSQTSVSSSSQTQVVVSE